MIYRLQSFFAGAIAFIVAALLALAPASAKPMSGGYQIFEPVALEHQHAIQLASLEDFDYHAKVAPECCNATNGGRFSGIQARNADESQFLRNAEATFGESTTWTSVTRHRGELVVQRSDIELSPQNITRMQNGQAPFVRNANGDWEPLQLHHVGRETGQMIEVTWSQNLDLMG
ncbi:hypothetical protein GTA62_07405 [Roseobacter sp. HKCCD9010]|uniref:HNH/ENDO VII family nuclease n=1 Tax=unclassified Roseobacter TaxID=196798 RepID=UPI001490E397|nr:MULTISPECIES: HNH/ENDO VII family nuclease [unclassified Roseobacter]MBF9052258.1 hypothetical protein [Rhodobacterales bacterium HKCCD4356]NNV14097.1 hypothetical protein [Roseobacter sp. HKCCD7357]NNV18418.1 hypothetical protein [Roseobacter sp. HKCCD8768]NNV27857.1 hypothetical protein [Roseobacter sp. HKCCD8192]NNV32151.1 hypothetical protein [Roseobacter sp. HKCCD9061]